MLEIGSEKLNYNDDFYFELKKLINKERLPVNKFNIKEILGVDTKLIIKFNGV